MANREPNAGPAGIPNATPATAANGKQRRRRSAPDAAAPCSDMATNAKPRRLPKLGLHRPTGQARVILAGREYYCGRWGTPEAHAKYAALLRQYLDRDGRPIDTTPTVVEAGYLVRDLVRDYQAWLDTTGRYTKSGEPTSQRVYVDHVLRSFVAFVGAVPVRRLSEALLVQWRDRLEGRRQLTRNGINRKVRALLAVLRWGRARGHLPRDAFADCAAIEPLRRGECGSRPERGRPRRAPSFADIEKVAAACTSRHVAAMLRLQALTAARPGEIAAMRWQDIDQTPVDAGDGVRCWTYRVAAPKTAHHGKAVQYYLAPAAQAILREFPGVPGAYVFSPDVSMAERRQALRAARRTPVTDATRKLDAARTRGFGSRWITYAYRTAVNRACAAAGVERFSPHEVRHAALTWIANSLGVTAAMAVANHASAQVTARYVHRDERQALAAIAAVQRRVGG